MTEPVLAPIPFRPKSLNTIDSMKEAVMKAENTSMNPIPNMWMLYIFRFIVKSAALTLPSNVIFNYRHNYTNKV